jgi:hypothetical protein
MGRAEGEATSSISCPQTGRRVRGRTTRKERYVSPRLGYSTKVVNNSGNVSHTTSDVGFVGFLSTRP